MVGSSVTEAESGAPAQGKTAFNCPSCGVYAAQVWVSVTVTRGLDGEKFQIHEGDLTAARCTHCRARTVWYGTGMIHPLGSVGPRAHADMPGAVRGVYDEARAVAGISPRSAAGLLRLALQQLIDDLEPGRGDVNGKIGKLVARGLGGEVQQAMDVLRVVGNNAVHPGQIDLDGDGSLVPSLFALVNLIVERMIAQPKRVAGLYDLLPDGARDAISRRDSQGS